MNTVTKTLKPTTEVAFHEKMKHIGATYCRVFYRHGFQVWEYRIGQVVMGEKREIVSNYDRYGEMSYYC